MNNPTIAVIGGGAAGLMCACTAAKNGAKVILFEKNRSEKQLASERFFDNAYLGKKLLITGKGRCNVTNACTREAFLASVTANPKFLYAAFRAFPPEKVMRFFEDAGVPLKTERGNRVFPLSDKSIDILRAFKRVLAETDTAVINRAVTNVEKAEDGDFLVTDETGVSHRVDRVVICTGGVSYPQTGSDGDGYAFAKRFGHTVTPLLPSLVPLECVRADVCRAMSGLSLKNVRLTVVNTAKKKAVYSEMGEMLFTHFGISGPLVLSASAHMRDAAPSVYRADIDLKPALEASRIDEKLVKLFEVESKKNLANVLRNMLPQSMTEPFCAYVGIPADTKTNAVTREKRRALAEAFKCFSFDIAAFRPIAEAIVTAGGVNVKEINPSTMQSKLADGLYFAGEVLDVDAYTGGFNLQIAFSTAYLAGISASASK